MRINLVDPKNLTDQHLIAEYHELLMALHALERNINVKSNIPDSFCLGSGHINFFKNKIEYLKDRHCALRIEMIRRGFKPQLKADISKFPQHLINNWQPDEKDLSIIKERLVDRISQKPEWYRYFGKHFPEKYYTNLLNV